VLNGFATKGQTMRPKRIRFYLVGVLWGVGLLIAGSDSAWMPWPNLAGLALFFITARALSGKKAFGLSRCRSACDPPGQRKTLRWGLRQQNRLRFS
jgi:hypothetical protein